MSLFERKDGAIYAYGDRIVFFRLKTRAALRATIIDLLGPEGGALMLRLIGQRIGENSARLAKERGIVQELGEETFEKLKEIYANSGRGVWEFKLENGSLKVIVRNSFEAAAHLEAFKKSDKPSCYFIQGYLKGLASGLLGKEVQVKETKCLAKGDGYCEFVIRF